MTHPLPSVSARMAVVRALAAYIEPLEFVRPGPPSVAFKLKRVWREWPPAEKRLDFPSVSITAGEAEYDDSLFTPSVVEDTHGVFAPGTALVQLAEISERLQVDVWAATPAEREAVVAGLEAALNPGDAMYGLDLPLADYYSRSGSYLLHGVEWIDDERSAQGERRARLLVDAIAPVVALHHVQKLRPEIRTEYEGEGA